MNELDAKIDVCEFLSYYSAKTWHDLMCVHHELFKMYEVTITQNLVREFLIHKKMFSLPMHIYESVNEQANGNDLEIFVETQNGFLFIPVQVKVIKQGYKYPSINHPVGTKQQIDCLIDYANKKRGIPAYIFYNYCEDYEFEDYVSDYLPGLDTEQFGCTIGNAYSINSNFFERAGLRKWSIPTFQELHMPLNYAVPLLTAFSRLINGNSSDVSWFLTRNNSKYFQQIRYYSFEELHVDESWDQMLPPPKISGVSNLPGMGDPFEHPTIEPVNRKSRINLPYSPALFTPKYRIIISANHRGGIWEVS